MNQRSYTTRFRVIVLLLTIVISSTACISAPKVVPVTKVIKVPVDRYVPVEEELTQKGEVISLPPRAEYEAMSGKGALIFLGWMAISNEENLIQCYNQLDEIAALGRD